jgi:hypothetical protein
MCCNLQFQLVKIFEKNWHSNSKVGNFFKKEGICVDIIFVFKIIFTKWGKFATKYGQTFQHCDLIAASYLFNFILNVHS